MSTTFTVLIPTHDHADTLWYSVQSVLNQTRQDFEIFVVGDGVPDRTREIVAAMTARDNRVRFFDNPKGERHGEAHRHLALRQAAGRYVCYLGDDDLWFPDHLELMAGMLAEHDLAHTMQITLMPEGNAVSTMFDGRHEGAKDRMRRSETGFGLSSGGHAMEAYRRLRRGWHPAPQGINTDLHFWLQFLDEPWCRYASLKWPTVCHLSSVPRKQWSNAERVAELAAWWPRALHAESRMRIVREALLPINEQNFVAAQPNAAMVLADEAVSRLEAEVVALRRSLSWKVTRPLRWLAHRAGGKR